MNELNGYNVSDCVHAIDLYENEIKEVCCHCDEFEYFFSLEEAKERDEAEKLNKNL